MPIPERFWEIAPEANHFLVSYLRSGSRWMRLLISDVLFTTSGRGVGSIYDFQIRKELGNLKNIIVPDELNECPDVYAICRNGSLPPGKPPVFYRAHSYDAIQARETTRCVYIFRHPASMLHSCTTYALSMGHLPDSEEDKKAFAAARIVEWTASVRGAIEHAAGCPARFRLVRYSEGNPFSTDSLETALDMFEIPAGKQHVENAVSRFKSFLEELNKFDEFDYARGGSLSPNMQQGNWRGVEESIRRDSLSAYEQALTYIEI